MLVVSGCSASEPDRGELSCSTSDDCPRGRCTSGECIDGYCTYSGIGCPDGGDPAPACSTTADCALDACGRQTICVMGQCGEIQRACDAGMPSELSCSTSLDCPRGQCTLGQCLDGECRYAAIACDGGIATDCVTTEDCGLDACERQTICVAGFCGEIQRACDAAVD
jgi:hypothetical protein